MDLRIKGPRKVELTRRPGFPGLATFIFASIGVMLLLGPSVRAAVRNKVNPVLATPPGVEFNLGGFVGDRLRANLNEWELRVPAANPAMIQMFRDRDRKPGRNLLPWSGEFAGKYLCASILSYRLLKDPRQKALIGRTVNALIDTQGPDGYLGPFDRAERLTGNNWDLWGHYWVMRALIMDYQEFGSTRALQSAERAADLLVRTFLNKDISLTNDGSFGQMNYAVIHAFTLLYRITGRPQYLAMANWIVRQWDKPGAGLYLKLALAGKEMYEFPGNRWESLHDFMGLYELYLLTGGAKYREAFTHIWYSILKGDRHNTGGCTSGEHTTGDPYDLGTIETCATVAWIDLSVDMLKLTGNSRVADEIELSTYNGNLGGQSPAGGWWTFTTPMDGVKRAAVESINFQCRPGSPDLNCCSVNGPRGLGLLAEWAILKSGDGVALNFYGPGTIKTQTPGGNTVTLRQETEYPVNGKVQLQVGLGKPETFDLKLRIPGWSRATRVLLNGKEVSGVKAGSYLSLARPWKSGDSVEIDFDMALHFWAGEREEDGKTSVYRGPILLAFDPTYNEFDAGALPEMDARRMSFEFVRTELPIQPLELLRVKAIDGTEVTLCDFPSAGAYGNLYRTWLPIRNVKPLPFDPSRPVWNYRP